MKSDIELNSKNNIEQNNQINEGKDKNIKDNNIINNIDKLENQEEKNKNLTYCFHSNFKSAYYQYLNNNNCSSSNKSKDIETKSKQTKYLIGNNEALNHLIYFTNSLNKTGILPGTTSKTKSEVNNGNG